MATEFPEGVPSTLEDTQGQQIKEVKSQDTRNKKSTWHPSDMGNTECKVRSHN